MDENQNQAKYENYRVQFGRLNKALNSGFNLEAMFIEYAILEDRTESILRHADKWEAYVKSRKGRNPAIDSKIRYIRKMAEEQGSLANRYFASDLLDRILVWKDERNRLIHALLKQQLKHEEIRQLAEEGKTLAEELRKCAGNYNRAVERRKAKEKLL